MNWSVVGIVAPILMAIGAAWVSVNGQISALTARMDDWREEVKRLRDRVDKFVDGPK